MEYFLALGIPKYKPLWPYETAELPPSEPRFWTWDTCLSHRLGHAFYHFLLESPSEQRWENGRRTAGKMSPIRASSNDGLLWNKAWNYNWLVVYLPLWKIWKSVGMMTFPIYGKIKFMFQTTNQTATINYPKLMRIPQGGAPFVQKDAASSCRAVDFLVPEIDPVLAGTTRNQLLATLTLKYFCAHGFMANLGYLARSPWFIVGVWKVPSFILNPFEPTPDQLVYQLVYLDTLQIQAKWDLEVGGLCKG